MVYLWSIENSRIILLYYCILYYELFLLCLYYRLDYELLIDDYMKCDGYNEGIIILWWYYWVLCSGLYILRCYYMVLFKIERKEWINRIIEYGLGILVLGWIKCII